MTRSSIAKLVGLALIAAALAAPVVAAPPPRVSNVTVVPTPSLAQHLARYTIMFRTSGSGALLVGDKITLKFPAGTVPGASCGDLGSFTNNVRVNGVLTSVSSIVFCLEVKVDVPVAIPANTNVTVVMGSVTTVIRNPGAGRYSIKVHTTKDFADANSQKYTIAAQHAPVAGPQILAPSPEDAAIPITLTGSDSDGDPLAFSIVSGSGPAHGSLSAIGAPVCSGLVPNTCTAGLTYTPTGNFNGADSFRFRVNDGVVSSAAATITISVAPVNDAPNAVDDAASVLQDSGANVIAVLSNDGDVDGDSLTITGNTSASDGTATCGLSSCSYTPDPGFSGTDSFTYTIGDGNGGSDSATVVVEVTPEPPEPPGGSIEIDLCGLSGTANLGPTSVPIWGFALMVGPDCTGELPELPGPDLGLDTADITAGDEVTVNLHNGVIGQDISLEFLGQVASEQGVGSDKTYTFTANDPGTFLYEARDNRQVLMGLYGALVVRPLTAGRAYDGAATAFDVEAVLVLSEVDPAFNADPSGFDLVDFKPMYWLINGKAYPATASISADPGEDVLLRYVNAGGLHHTMALLGIHERVIGKDAFPVRFPFDVVSETIPAGSTMDAIATVPASATPLTKFWLYNRQFHLDDAGSFPGGMLTFLITGP